MSMLLKVMHAPNHGPDPDQSEHSVYSDVVSVSFRLGGDRQCQIHAYVREPIKTALVPGFCENEKIITLGYGCAAYLMNENGRTVSQYVAPLVAGSLAGLGRRLPERGPRDFGSGSETSAQSASHLSHSE